MSAVGSPLDRREDARCLVAVSRPACPGDDVTPSSGGAPQRDTAGHDGPAIDPDEKPGSVGHSIPEPREVRVSPGDRQ